jgi:hypothetical protein
VKKKKEKNIFLCVCVQAGPGGSCLDLGRQ